MGGSNRLRATLVLAVLTVPVVAVAPAAEADSIKSLARFYPRDDTSAVWTGTHAYVFGGHMCNGNYWFYCDGSSSWDSGEIVRFDPETKEVRTMGAGIPGRSQTAAVWDGQYAYVIGGTHGGREIRRYDPATDTQRLVAVLPEKLAGPSAAFDGQYVWIAGSKTPLDSVYDQPSVLYRWDRVSDVPEVALTWTGDYFQGSSMVWTGTEILIFGGKSCDPPPPFWTGPCSSSAQLVRYDPVTRAVQDQWMPFTRWYSAAVWDGTYAYVLGGGRLTYPEGEIWRFDPARNTWTLMPVGLEDAVSGVSAIWDGKFVWVFGGVDAQESPHHVGRIQRYAISPDPPRNLVVETEGPGALRVTWDPPDYVGSQPPLAYVVHRTEVATGARTDVRVEGTTWLDAGLENGATYRYSVGSENFAGEGFPSAPVVGRTLDGPPSRPRDFTADAGPQRGEIQLAWREPLYDSGREVFEYRIFRDGALHARLLGGVRYFLESGLADGEAHDYEIVAVTELGEGKVSADSARAPVPAGAVEVEGTSHRVGRHSEYRVENRLELTTTTDGGTAPSFWRIYRRDLGGERALVAESFYPRWTDTAVARGQPYLYSASAVNTVGEGPIGNETLVQTLATEPTGPVRDLFAVHVYQGSGKVTWTRPADDGGAPITHYRVRYWNTHYPDYVKTVDVPAALDHTSVVWYNHDFHYRGTSIRYEVTPANAVGFGPSAAVDEQAWQPPPAPPVDVVAARGPLGDEITLTWKRPDVDDWIHYEVFLECPGGWCPVADDVAREAWTATDLEGSTTYRFALRTWSYNGGHGPLGAAVEATTWPPPPAPSSLAIEGGAANGHVHLTWSPVVPEGPAVLSYRVEHALAADFANATAVDVGLATSWNATLEPAAVRHFRVRALNGLAGHPSASVDTTGLAWPPSAPLALAAAPGAAAGTAELAWDPPVSDGNHAVTAWRVYRTDPGGAEALRGEVAERAFSDTGLLDGEAYAYRVAAVNAVGEGAPSAPATVVGGNYPPQVPRAPAAASVEPGRVALAWEPPESPGSAPVTSWRVYRGETADALALHARVVAFERLHGFDADAEGFVRPADRTYSEVAWDPVDRRVELRLDRRDTADEVLERPVGERLDPSTSFVLQARLGTASAGEWQRAWPLFLASDAAPRAGGQPDTLAFTFYGDGNKPRLGVQYVDGSGVVRFAGAAYTSVGKAYVARAEYDAETRELRARILDETGAAIVDRRWVVGTMPGDGFAFDRYGFSTDEMPEWNGWEPPTTLWVDDVRLAPNDGRLAFEDSVPKRQTRWYSVSAVSAIGEGPATDPVSATALGSPPSAPRALSVSSGPALGEITVAWTPSEDLGGFDAAAYRVYAAPAEDGPFALVAETQGLSFLHEGLGDGTTRWYAVAGVNELGEGPRSPARFARTFAAPSEPQRLTARGDLVEGTYAVEADGSVELEWRAPRDAGGLSLAYWIHRVREGETNETVVPAGANLSFTDVPGEPGLYHYRVSATNAVGPGPRSLPSHVLAGNLPAGLPTVREREDGSLRVDDDNGTIASTPPTRKLEKRPPFLLGGEIVVYQMDEDDHHAPSSGKVRDASGRGNHGSFGFLAREPTVVDGRHGEGFRFSRTNEYVVVPDAPTSNLPEGTLMMWIRMEALQAGYGLVFGKVDPGVTSELGVSVGTDGRVHLTTSQRGGSTPLASSTPLPVGAWVHLAVTWGPEGKRIYLDGALDAADFDTTGVGGASRSSRIAADPNNAGRTGLKATVDEFRVYGAQLPPEDIRRVADAPYAEASA